MSERLTEVDRQFRGLIKDIEWSRPAKLGLGLRMYQRRLDAEIEPRAKVSVHEIFRSRPMWTLGGLALGQPKNHTLRTVELRDAPKQPVERYIWFPGNTDLMVTKDMEMLSEKGGFTTFDLFGEQAQGLTTPLEGDWQKLEDILELVGMELGRE